MNKTRKLNPVKSTRWFYVETSLLRGVKPRPVSQDFQSFSLIFKSKSKTRLQQMWEKFLISRLSNSLYCLTSLSRKQFAHYALPLWQPRLLTLPTDSFIDSGIVYSLRTRECIPKQLYEKLQRLLLLLEYFCLCFSSSLCKSTWEYFFKLQKLKNNVKKSYIV